MTHAKHLVNNEKDRSPLDAAKQKLPEYLESIGLDPTKNMLCLFHAEDKPSMGVTPDQQHVHCFACGVTADLVDVIAQVEGLTPRSKEAIDRTIEWAGTGCVGNAPRGKSKSESTKRPSPKTKPSAGQNTSEPPTEPPNFHEYIEQCAQHFDDSDCRAYLASRGFGDDDFETLRSFRLGYDVERRLLIIPHSDLYYTARPIDPVDKADRFKHNPKGAKAEIFNVDAIENENNDVVAVCEGAIDALSLIVCGIPAVGLPGVHNCHKQLIDACLIDHPFSTVARIDLGLILAFDNDKGGADATNSLIQKLNKVEALYDSVAMPDGANDINDAFKSDRNALISLIAPIAKDLQSSIDKVRDIRIARSEPSVIFNRICKNALDFPDSAISPLVFEEVALIASAVAAEHLPAEYSAYRNFVKEHGVDMALFNEQVKKYRKKEDEENNIIVPIKPGVTVGPYAPPDFDSQGDLPPLPNGEQWNFTLEGIYRIDRDGIFKIVENRLGGLEWKQISHSAIYISNFIQNIDNGNHRLQLTAYNHGYGWTSSPSIPASDIGSSNKIINLGDWGFDINSNNAKNIIDYLSSFKAVNSSNIPRIKAVNRPGWQKDGSFVYPNASGDLQLDGDLKDMLSPIFTSAGAEQPIIDLLKKHRDKPVLNLVIGAALAAPLVKILNCQNIAVHFYSNTGSGKSSVNRIAMALFGDPTAEGALPTANATKSGLENFFDSRHDLPAFVEDIDSVSDERSKRVIAELPYQFVNKTGRLRAKKTGGNDRLIDFRGSLITNGERPLTTSTSSGGGKRRLIEYCAPDQIFDKDEARLISDTIMEHHGLFGHQWIKFIQKNDKQLFRNAFKKLRLGSDEVPGFYELYPSKIPLHIDTIAAITVANMLFCKMIGDTDKETDAFFLEWACDMIETLPDEIEIKDSERAKDFIRDFVLSHPKNFTSLIETQVDPTTRFMETDSDISGYEKYGAWRSKYLAMFPSVLRKALSDAGFSPEIILKQLADDGFILRGDSARLTRRVRIEGTAIWMICFDRAKFGVSPEQGNAPTNDNSPQTPNDEPVDKEPDHNTPAPPIPPPDEYYIPPDDQLPPPPDEEYWESLTGIKPPKPTASTSPSQPTKTQKAALESLKLKSLAEELSRRVIDEHDAEAASKIYSEAEDLDKNILHPQWLTVFLESLDPLILLTLEMKSNKREYKRMTRWIKSVDRRPAADTISTSTINYSLPSRDEMQFETMPEPKD